MDTQKDTYTRREFNQLAMMFVALFTGASQARGGIDAPQKNRRKKRKSTGREMMSTDEAGQIQLAIDFPTEEGWYIVNPLRDDDFKRVNIESDTISPRQHRQLKAAKAAPYGTPIVARVLGDRVAVLDKATYFEPGEPDDREEGEFDEWRIEYCGDGIRRVAPDNNSWWQARLKHGPEFSSREIAFAEYWLKENNEDLRYAINSGCGLAQDLMLSTYQHEKPEGFEPWLSNRERKILATFVQWLGTNCGQGFLHEVGRRGKFRTGGLAL